MSETDVAEPEAPEVEPRENGLRPIDRIRRATRNRRRSIEIEDWDLTLYFGPLTTSDVEAVDAAMEDDGKEPQQFEHERRLRLLVEKAELEDGSPAFRPGDIHYLKSEADYVTLQRLIGHMYRSAVSVEQAKKDSGESATSETD